ncbi:MFS general substrate transporter [Rhizodiscina lignyota]|uniref:MFS general substrate transporter n=1 Tax=Rhizodiscina lignyota TaxID=1504668 RepID=A0A9P4I9Q1_9PEZI|nr:MFS general substrate transporter [Rhizodiscina lignyota]
MVLEKTISIFILLLSSPSAVAHSGERVEYDEEPEPEPEPQVIVVDNPPNGGYGWVCVAASAMINGHTWGLNSSYSVFLAHYLATNTFPGASRLDFAFIGGLSIGTAMVVSPVATASVRRFGTNMTLLIGVFFESGSFIGASFTKSIWQLFLSQGLCFGLGMGFLFVASVGVAPQWFTTRRSLAGATAAAGSGLGGLIYSLAANAMIQSIGLPWAFRVLGIICFVVNTISSLLMRDRNKLVKPNQLSFDYRLFRNLDFILLSAWGIFSMLGYIVLIFSLANYARTVGLTAKQGSVISALLNLGQMIGRPPIGYFSDAMGRLNMATIMTFLCGIFALVIWIFAKSYGVLIFFALIGGTVAGTFWATIGPVAAEVFGLKELPSVLNLTWLIITLPTTFSEPIALEIVSFNGGSYLGAQIFTGFMYIGAAASLWALRARKLGALERVAAQEHRSAQDINPVTEGTEIIDEVQNASEKQELDISPYFSRLVKWRRV